MWGIGVADRQESSGGEGMVGNMLGGVVSRKTEDQEAA